jgi:hypothetical protein
MQAIYLSSQAFWLQLLCLEMWQFDKFESRSSDGILHGYTPHGKFYRVLNLETNTVVESYDLTFDETAPCPHGISECASDMEMKESVFLDEGL